MLSYKRRDVVNSFWDGYSNAGFDKQHWRETSKNMYRYISLGHDNGELAIDGLRQSSTVRIPCAIPDIILYLWVQPNGRYICLMFHEVGQKELYVHRYAMRAYGND